MPRTNIILSDSGNPAYNNKLSTTNGFYQVEARNLGVNSGTLLALSTARYIDVTFANAGNCRGIVLGLHASHSAATTPYSVKVTLQENVASVWTDRVSKILTSSEINPELASGGNSYVGFAVPFKFDTPYAVDTTASKWRFRVADDNSSGTVTAWRLLTSNGTVPSYATWCDTQVTATNGDVIIVVDKVVIDKSFTTGAVTSTGDTAYGMAGWICRNTDISEANIALLEWENPPVSSYTLNLGGEIWIGSFSGFRVGTEANPIPAAQKAIITRPSAAVAGTVMPGFCASGGTTSGFSRHKSCLFLHGEVPTNRVAYLASDAAISQANCVLTEDLSAIWTAGDEVYVGKQDLNTGQGTLVTQTIGSFSGTTMTLSTNLLTNVRKAGGVVLNFSRGYGIELLGNSNTNYLLFTFINPSRFKMCGVKYKDLYVNLYNGLSNLQYPPLAANRGQYQIHDIIGQFTGTTIMALVPGTWIPPEGISCKRNYSFRNSILYDCYAYYYRTLLANPSLSGLLEYKENIVCAQASTYFRPNAFAIIEVDDNKFFNSNTSAPFINIQGKSIKVRRNEFWANSATANFATSGGAIYIGAVVNPLFSDNKFNKCTTGYNLNQSNTIIGARSSSDIFGDEAANTKDITLAHGSFYDFVVENSIGTIVVDTTDQLEAVNVSKLKIVNEDEVAGADRTYSPVGNTQRCGTGLSDTTTHSPTGSSLRFESIQSAEAFTFSQYIPTGDIDGKDMVIAVWVKINNAAYWAGTNQLPRLTVEYDNGVGSTYAQAAATTDWQLLTVPFTPTTNYGRIKVTFSCLTDATGSNAYVYWDDLSSLFPSGVNLNLGSMDIWADGEPITPMISTSISATDVWVVPEALLTGIGTIGNKLRKGLTLSEFIALK